MHEWNKKPIGFVILFDTVFWKRTVGEYPAVRFFM